MTDTLRFCCRCVSKIVGIVDAWKVGVERGFA